MRQLDQRLRRAQFFDQFPALAERFFVDALGTLDRTRLVGFRVGITGAEQVVEQDKEVGPLRKQGLAELERDALFDRRSIVVKSDGTIARGAFAGEGFGFDLALGDGHGKSFRG